MGHANICVRKECTVSYITSELIYQIGAFQRGGGGRSGIIAQNLADGGMARVVYNELKVSFELLQCILFFIMSWRIRPSVL